MRLKKDYFAEKANGYDAEKNMTQNVSNIAQGILKEISFSKKMKIMDFGSGTGLLLSQIAPYVGSITAVDISKSMNDILCKKEIACEIQMLELDLTKEQLNEKFDSIISSMTLHHIDRVNVLFKKFYNLLENNGTIAIADLDIEDGSFHTEDTGVFHLGFNREEFKGFARDAGFRNIKIQSTSVVEKPTGNYHVFLLTAEK